MCGIAGVVINGDNVGIGSFLKKMLQTIQHRGPDGTGCVIDGVLERKMRLQDLNLEKINGQIALGQVGLAINEEITSLQPFQSDSGHLSLLHNGEIYNHRDLRLELGETHSFTKNKNSEVILKLIEKEYDGDLLSAAQKIIPKIDGVYALVITDDKEVVIARDKIGLRQLYYCTNGDYTAFATEKKPLMAISHQTVEYHRLLPGHMAVVNGKDIKVSPFWNPQSLKSPSQISDREEALKAYGGALTSSILKRTFGKKRVGIVFSGGIDSFLLAYMIQKLGIPFTCYTAGRKGSSDIEWASTVANQYKFPLKVKTFTLKDIENVIPEIITTIEDHSLNQVEAATAMYIANRTAQEHGEQMVMTGQGADEIFGGYPWYPKIVDQEGYDSFEKYSWEDTLLGYKETFERENKIAMAHGLEMSVPYTDPEVIRVAFSISPELKIKRGNDRIQKRLHREYGVSIGISKEIAFREKEAAQHGANVHGAFEELANMTGVTEAMLEDAGYDPNVSVTEKLGSSSRYGFRYGDHHLWRPLSHVQYYLDSIAADLNLLPAEVRYHWEKITGYLQSKGLIRRNEL